uniref:Serine-rich adhesin for platelets-like n=1 Tax=Astyanax mexicanus TaxID=7994 RepID=A0A3B1IDS0_ASTMX
MTGVCVFPKICVNHRQADPVLVFLDMRASSLLLLTFIFTAAEYPLHIFGVNGKCEEPKQGNNYGNIPDNISYEENSKFRMPCVEGYLRKAGTSNLFRCQTNNTHGQLEWNNWPPLNCTPDPRKQRSTTDDPTTGPGKGDRLSSKAVGGIAAGTVLLLIVVAGSAAGIFILCRRQDVSSTAVEMRLPPGSDQPLLDTHTATLLTSCPDSAQNPKTDPLIVVQQA